MGNERPRRVAAYCRVANYSQLDIDPLDMQVALVKEYAQGRGMEVFCICKAHEVGRGIHRISLQKLYKAIKETKADCVVIQSSSRLCRDPRGLAHIFNRLSALGVRTILSVKEGTIPLPPIRDPTNSFSSPLRGGDAVEG